MDPHHEFLIRERNRDRTLAIVGCAAMAGVAGLVYALASPFEDLVSAVVLLSAALGGVLRYHHEKASVERIERELGEPHDQST